MPEQTPEERVGLVAALRADPAHASELLLCSVLPSLAGETRRWVATSAARHGRSPDEAAHVAARRARATSRRDGAVTGTSFYLGMPAAMASIYCHQVLMILKIAALYGHDPDDPARAAEILVLRGRHQDLAAASAALVAAGRRRDPSLPRTPPLRQLADLLRSLPGKVKEQLGALREKGVLGAAAMALRVATYLVPFLGMPYWAISYARQTRAIGRKSIAFYGPGSDGAGAAPSPAGDNLTAALRRFPPLPRHLLAGLAIGAGVVTLALIVAFRTSGHHRLLKFTFLLAGLFITTCYARLWWILRADRRT